MFTFHIEPMHTMLEVEMENLITGYYDSMPEGSEIPPFDFDWDTYYRLSEIGSLLVTTARYDGKLVGCAMYVLGNAPHHRTVKVAMCDGIAMDPAHRGKGLGKALYTYSEQALRSRGVERVTHNYRVCYGTKPMFEDLGFKVIEHVYMKEL